MYLILYGASVIILDRVWEIRFLFFITGMENLDSGVGVYAPDAEAYSVFRDLFDPIIEEYHGGFGKDQHHPQCDFGDPGDFGNLDPDSKYVVSTRVRCGRSLDEFPFNPCMTKDDYINMEQKVSIPIYVFKM